MKRKFSTVLENRVFRKLKLESVRQGKPISAIVSEALESYLGPTKHNHRDRRGVVEESWGSLRVDPAVLKRLMEEEDSLLDS